MVNDIKVVLRPSSFRDQGRPYFLRELGDVDVTNTVDGSLLIYDATDEKFKASTTLEKQTIKIKRSDIEGEPTTLASGELFYSYLQSDQSNGGDRLYIGTGTETTTNQAPNIEVIGGKYFTEKLNHTVGILTANSAILVDADKSINELIVGQLNLIGSTISSTTGEISFDNSQIKNVANPTESQDVATKSYVDATTLNVKKSVEAATADDLGGTYDNGIQGIGSNITIPPTETLDIDGWSDWSLQDGILVKSQINSEENGRYVVTQVGDISTEWILTRGGSSDAPSEVIRAFVFVVNGNTYGSTGWVATVDNFANFSVGVDPIYWEQFSSVGDFTAGDGLTLDGTQFNVDVDDETIELFDSVLRVKDLGITNQKIFNPSISFAADVGDVDVVSLGETLTFTSGQGIATEVSDNTIIISGTDATNDNKGIASFNLSNFAVDTGDVLISMIDGGSY